MFDGASHRFATVFANEPFPRTALYDLTSDQYTQAVADYSKTGYRPISVSGYETAVGPRFATVFSLDNQVKDWEARHGLTVAGYQHLAARLSPAGLPGLTRSF
jgi:hypothetical protein